MIFEVLVVVIYLGVKTCGSYITIKAIYHSETSIATNRVQDVTVRITGRQTNRNSKFFLINVPCIFIILYYGQQKYN